MMMKSARRKERSPSSMIDIHCHILFDIDDGARDVDETMNMCSIAAEDGITAIIATPHYIEGESTNAHLHDRLSMINHELKNRSMNLCVLPGNEIYLGLDTYEHLKQGRCLSLNHSRYVLVEFSMMEIAKYVSDALYNLRIKGYIPIIAHPERNVQIMEKPQLLYDFIIEGCLVQINSTSLIGLSGKEARRTAELLLKHRMVHFIASDAHSSKHRKPVLSQALSCADRIWGLGTGDKLININPQAVVDDAEIQIEEPIKLRKRENFLHIFR